MTINVLAGGEVKDLTTAKTIKAASLFLFNGLNGAKGPVSSAFPSVADGKKRAVCDILKINATTGTFMIIISANVARSYDRCRFVTQQSAISKDPNTFMRPSYSALQLVMDAVFMCHSEVSN